MLEGLDRIDWKKLETAYGEASDVPDMLQALASNDDKERHTALHAAYGNIFHQGTRYSATPHAIPFVIEIAAHPTAKERAELLSLVAHCVAGYFGPTAGPFHASGAIWGAKTKPMSDYGETLEILEACERAAEPAVPLALDLATTDADPDVRSEALHVLAALRRFADTHDVVGRLRDRFTREGDASVRAMLAFALGHLLPMKDPMLANAFRDDDDDLVRLLVAMGSARRGEATREMAGALVAWLDDESLGERYVELPFDADDLAGDIGALLDELGPDALREALPTLIERLAHADDFGAVGVLSAALSATFGDAKAPTSSTELTPPQRQLLETLVKNQAFWTIGNATSLLMDRGLPSWDEAMAEFLGIEVAHDPREAARLAARMSRNFGAARALQAWLEMLEEFPDDLEALVHAGLLLVNSDRHDEAMPLFERFIANAPDDAEHFGEALFGLGNTLSAAGRLEEAYDAFTRAQQRLRGEQAESARQNRIAMLQQLDRPNDALAIELERTPNDANGFYHRGLAQVKAGRYAECIASIERALELRPEDAGSHYTIACAHALMGNADAALASIARALEINPELAPDIEADSDFESLAADPRFRALFRRTSR